MRYPKCEVCNQEIENWSGNVMILDNLTSDEEIDDLQIWCKPCTNKLDAEGTGKQYHNLWELSWVKEDGDTIMIDSAYASRFSQKVKNKVDKIISLR